MKYSFTAKLLLSIGNFLNYFCGGYLHNLRKSWRQWDKTRKLKFLQAQRGKFLLMHRKCEKAHVKSVSVFIRSFLWEFKYATSHLVSSYRKYLPYYF